MGIRNRPLGQSGIQASMLGFGAWAIGGWLWGGTDEHEAVAAIHTALDKGINLIDTAPLYGFGKSERVIRKAIKGQRNNVVLATKCGLVWNERHGDFFFNADPDTITQDDRDRSVFKYLGPDSIREELEQSLRHLGTDHVDIYQTHWPESTTPIDDTMATLLDLKAEGKIRAVGACNVSVDQIKAYQTVGPLDSVQCRYSMIDRGAESGLMPYLHDEKIAAVAYSPLARGLLTGKVGIDRRFGNGDGRWQQPRFADGNRQKVAAMLADIEPVAVARELTIAQVVLAWTLAQPGVTHVLVGARSASQAIENAQAMRVFLTDDELAVIDKAIFEHSDGIV